MSSNNLYPSLPVLIVDDETAWLRSMNLSLMARGINNLITCDDSRKVRDILNKQPIGIVLLDLTMPHVSGNVLLEEIVREYPDLPVIVITGAYQVDAAVDCMKAGAFDYYVKTTEESRLMAGIKHAIEARELRSECQSLKTHVLQDTLEYPDAFAAIITQDRKMRSIFQYLESISDSIQPVLITGESGVGKELVARAIHTLRRTESAFVAVNVASLDDNMFADALFGHVKGAYTGAESARPGLVEQAKNGTLFLDEIGDLSLAAQVKLLRLLQEREYLPLGADVAKRCHARILVSTHRNLAELKEKGSFRNDLYFRLTTHQVNIPPLRERPADIPLLLDHFLAKAAAQLDKKAPSYPKQLLTFLQTYSFPGNVRELESMTHDAVSSHKSMMLSMDIFRQHIERISGVNADSRKETLVETQTLFTAQINLPTIKESIDLLIDEAMRRAGNNQTLAAQMLGITRQALNQRLKQKS